MESWEQMNSGVNDLARGLGMGSPRDAEMAVWLDELGAPSEDEALAWAAERDAMDEAARLGEMEP